jgi:hypothetical protein
MSESEKEKTKKKNQHGPETAWKEPCQSLSTCICHISLYMKTFDPWANFLSSLGKWSGEMPSLCITGIYNSIFYYFIIFFVFRFKFYGFPKRGNEAMRQWKIKDPPSASAFAHPRASELKRWSFLWCSQPLTKKKKVKGYLKYLLLLWTNIKANFISSPLYSLGPMEKIPSL